MTRTTVISSEFGKVTQALNAGKIATAAVLAEHLFRAFPQDANANLLDGMVAQHMGDYAKAIDRLRRACAIAPQAANAHFWLGLAERSIGNKTAAIDCLERALAIAPIHLTAFELALSQRSIGRVAEAGSSYFFAANCNERKQVEAKEVGAILQICAYAIFVRAFLKESQSIPSSILSINVCMWPVPHPSVVSSGCKRLNAKATIANHKLRL